MTWRNGALMECEATRLTALECYTALCSVEMHGKKPDGERVAELFARMLLTSLGGFLETADAHGDSVDIPRDVRERLDLIFAWVEGLVDEEWRERCYEEMLCG